MPLSRKILSTDLPAMSEQDQVRLVDRIFFGLGTIAAVLLALTLFTSGINWSWQSSITLLLGWGALAYLALPRLHRVLTTIYVPKYYIGRSRTSDGLMGDPVNLAFVGSAGQVVEAMESAGWVEADPVDFRSSVRIVTSTLSRTSYDKAPVSPLFLFGRKQDVAYQMEVEGNPAKRHHIRLWHAPSGWLMPGGRKVDWLASATYDRAVGLSYFTLQITHRIDADIDIERDFVLDSLDSCPHDVEVEKLHDFTTGYHCRNGGGDSIRTDGMLPVVDVGAVPERETTMGQPTYRRPHLVWLGAALIGLSALWNVLFFATVAHAINNAGALAEEHSTWLWGLTYVIMGATLIELLGVGFFVRGNDWARLALLLAGTVEVFAWLAWLRLQTGESTLASALTATLPLLWLVSLSSPAVQRWTLHETAPERLPEE